MASWLSNLVNNLSKGIHKIKCKYEHDDEKCETCRNNNVCVVTKIISISLMRN